MEVRIIKIWLINPYGPIPGENWRDYCYTMMADVLTLAGHEVVWWTSNFSHHFKKYRSTGWKDISVNEKFTLRLVPTTHYKNNISLGRVLRDIVFGMRTYQRGKTLSAPDCIIFSESPLSFGYAGFKLSRFFNCPIILHQMDLWPELIENIFPDLIKPFAKIIFKPIYNNRKKIYGNLDGVMALARTYLDVPLKEAPVLMSRPNAIIYNGIDVIKFRNNMTQATLPKGLLPEKKEGEIRAVFAGSLGPSYDIITLLNVAERLEFSQSNLILVIAGDGPLRITVEKFLSESNNKHLYYVGEVEPSILASLYKVCDIGLCTYSAQSNVEMPDKIYDYTAAGLPVINSLCGEVSMIIKERGIGLQYSAGEPNDLYEKLEMLVKETDLRNEMSKKSLETGMFFDRSVQYNKLLNIIEKVCS